MNFKTFHRNQELALEFERLCYIKAMHPDDQHGVLMAAKAAVKNGMAHPIIERAAQMDTHFRGPWSMVPTDRVQFAADCQKAAVAIATTTDASWASPLVALTTLANAWLASLRNISMLDAILEYALPFPPNTRFAVTTATGVGNNAAEATWIPMTKESFDDGTTRMIKSLSLVAVSNDLMTMGGELAQNLLSAELRNTVAIAADLIVAGILTNGLTPISSTGDPRTDLRKAFAAVSLGQLSKPMIFTAPDVLKQLALYGTADGPMLFPDISLPNGGTISGCPTMAADALHNLALGSPPSDCIVVCDAAQCAGDPGMLELTASQNAALQMVDTASGSSAVNLVSMFQTNSVALRGTRWFSLSRARATAVAVIEGVNYDPA